MTRDSAVATRLGPAPSNAPVLLMKDLGTLGGLVSKAIGINNNRDIIGESTTRSGERHAFLWRNGSMIDLGTLGGDYSKPAAINGLGQIVGESRTAQGALHAFLWQKGRMIDLGSLAGRSGYSSATAINRRGQVVGVSSTRSGAKCAFFWQIGLFPRRFPLMQALRSLGGDECAAVAINNLGVVAGWSYTSKGARHACIWNTMWNNLTPMDTGDPPAPFFDSYSVAITDDLSIVLAVLGTNLDCIGGIWRGYWASKIQSPDYMEIFPVGINRAGTVVGRADTGLLSRPGFIWKDGNFEDLGALNGGDPASGFTTEPTDINEEGVVVGSSTTNSGERHAFVWRNGVMADLGSLQDASTAVAINNKGAIVGDSYQPGGPERATLWVVGRQW